MSHKNDYIELFKFIAKVIGVIAVIFIYIAANSHNENHDDFGADPMDPQFLRR